MDEVLGYGNRLVEKRLVPDKYHKEIPNEVDNYREKWNELVGKAENLQKRFVNGIRDHYGRVKHLPFFNIYLLTRNVNQCQMFSLISKSVPCR